MQIAEKENNLNPQEQERIWTGEIEESMRADFQEKGNIAGDRIGKFAYGARVARADKLARKISKKARRSLN